MKNKINDEDPTKNVAKKIFDASTGGLSIFALMRSIMVTAGLV